MFELFTPAKLGQHRLFFTCGWTFVIFSVFWYMIGEFPYYEAVQFPDPQRSACLQSSSTSPMAYGSSQLVHWINQVCMGILRDYDLPCMSCMTRSRTVALECRSVCYLPCRAHMKQQVGPYGLPLKALHK